MANKIILNIMMLGGRRAGKTSTLAAMYDCFTREFRDTDLSISATGSMLDVLVSKKQEMTEYLACASRNGNFVPDDSPSDKEDTYSFQFKLKGKNDRIVLDFFDYPGEYLMTGHPQFTVVEEGIRRSDVLLIILDTPYLMEMDGRYNDVRNCCVRITNTIVGAEEKESLLPKLVLFVPIKCERYADDGRMDEVREKIMSDHCYGSLISALKDRCEMAITPIQTIGSAHFIGFERDREGDIIMDGFRKTIGDKVVEEPKVPKKPLYRFTERAKEAAKRQGLEQKYADDPRFCEQPAVYTLYYGLLYAQQYAKIKEQSKGKRIIEFTHKVIRAILKTKINRVLPFWEAISDESLTAVLETLEDRFSFAGVDDWFRASKPVFKKLKTEGDGYRVLLPDILDYKGEWQ